MHLLAPWSGGLSLLSWGGCCPFPLAGGGGVWDAASLQGREGRGGLEVAGFWPGLGELAYWVQRGCRSGGRVAARSLGEGGCCLPQWPGGVPACLRTVWGMGLVAGVR